MFSRFSRHLPRAYNLQNVKQLSNSNNSCIVINEEIREALESNRPVVALESTIVTHGMPFPDNVNCAKEVETLVRAQGAIPATIAILKGKIKVGLSEKDLEILGDVKISDPIKTSRRDFPYLLSNKRNGGTTIAGTLLVANKVGIKVFGTGGLGGVHRDVNDTLDISADLIELGKSRVAVVSSGVKSILDIPKTLEFLETQGVFVATFGENTEFPAFYTRISGSQSPYYVKNAKMAAKIIKSAEELELNSGLLFAVPIPEEYSLNQQETNKVIEDSLILANKSKIKGKHITPFLLTEVIKLTKGRSLESNIALIKNNAKVAADIAVALSKLSSCDEEMEEKEKEAICHHHHGQPVVIGGSNLDWTVKLEEPEIKLDGRCHFGNFKYTAGGVGRNMCEALAKLGCRPQFITAVGPDHQGQVLTEKIPKDCRKQLKIIKSHNTAQCLIVLDKTGDCSFLIGDMSIHSQITSELVEKNEELIKISPLVILDGNLSKECMESVLKIATKHNIPVFYEPTDVAIAAKPFETQDWKSIKFITPNINELNEIAKYFNIASCVTDENIENIAKTARKVGEHIENVIVTLGSKGLLIARKGNADESFLTNKNSDEIFVRHYPVEKVEKIVNVSGAGDCFASGFIAALLQGLSEEKCVSVGFASAFKALQSENAVPDNIFDKNHDSWKINAKYITLLTE